MAASCASASYAPVAGPDASVGADLVVAGSGADGAAVAGGGSGRGAGPRRRVVVCDGVRGVFTPGPDGVWLLAITVELRVWEGLGGSADGIGRLRGTDKALASQLAGPGDLGGLAECLEWVAAAYYTFEAGVPAELAAAVAAACSVWDQPKVRNWLCWALASRLAPFVTDAWTAGPGWAGWGALMFDNYAIIAWPESIGGPPVLLWALAASHPDRRVRGCARDRSEGEPVGAAPPRRRAAAARGARLVGVEPAHPGEGACEGVRGGLDGGPAEDRPEQGRPPAGAAQGRQALRRNEGRMGRPCPLAGRPEPGNGAAHTAPFGRR